MRIIIAFMVFIIFIAESPFANAEGEHIQVACMVLESLPRKRIENYELKMGTPDCDTFPNWTNMNINEVSKTDLEKQHHLILKPNDELPMDYIPDRLNIYIDDNNIIMHQVCG